jgi:hypothetical protein
VSTILVVPGPGQSEWIAIATNLTILQSRDTANPTTGAGRARSIPPVFPGVFPLLIDWLPAALLSSVRNRVRRVSRGEIRHRALSVEVIEPRLLLASPTWTPEGPGPINNGGGNLGIPNSPSIGAIRSIVVDPTNANTVYVASINGGIWKTTDAQDANPIWTPLTDNMPSLSTSSLSIDPANHQVLVAGIGLYSSDSGDGGPLTGVQLTTDGGATWQSLDGHGMLDGVNISAVLVRNNGSTILVASAAQALTGRPLVGATGMYRSTDGGATFSLLSGDGISGLPTGDVFDLVADPNRPATMYAAVGNAATGAGIYKSTDNGASWAKISNSTQDNELAAATGVQENAKIAVGAGGVVDVIIDDTAAGSSSDFVYQYNGTGWTTLDTPTTNENGTPEGLHPGGQGMLYLSIAADPSNANIVYVGGDRQPGPGDGSAKFPNSIGATDYTGRLFEIDAAQPPGSQATALTNNSSTNNNDGPHAGSLFMMVDSTGRLLEADGGGIYTRSNPTGKGDWSSLNSNLQVTEFVSTAYDFFTHQIVGGAVDNGNSVQSGQGGSTWKSIEAGAGNYVAVDDKSLVNAIGRSRVFTSSSYLQHFTETDYNQNGTIASIASNLGLIDTATGKSLSGGVADPNIGYYQPYVLNSVDPTHALIFTNKLWESLNTFQTVTNRYTSPGRITAAVYGGVHSGASNSGVFIVGDDQGNIAVRQSQSAAIDTFVLPGGAAIKAIAVNPTDWTQAYILDAHGTIWRFSYATGSHAGTFTSLTTLPAPNNSGYEDWRTLTAVPISGGFMLVAGGYGGIDSIDPTSGRVKQFGTLPNVIVNSVTYSQSDDVLVAGTLGRGAFLASNASVFLTPTDPSITIPNNSVTYTTPPGDPLILAPSATVTEPVPGADFSAGSLTVAVTGNAHAGDTLTIQNNAYITTSGNTIEYNGHVIGTYTTQNGGSELDIAFANNGFETATAVQFLVRQIAFSNGTAPGTAPRTVQFQVTDSLSQQSTPTAVTVDITNNGTPVLTLAPGPVTLNAPLNPPVLVAPGGTLTDTGASSFEGGQLSVTISNNASAGDQLLVLNSANISVSGNSVLYNSSVIGHLSGGLGGAPLVVLFTTADATTASVQALVQAIGFNDPVDPPSTAQRTLTFQVIDAQTHSSNSANVLVDVVSVSLPPIVVLQPSLNYTAGGAAATVSPSAAVSDPDSPNLNGGSLSVSIAQGGMGNDRLTIHSQGNAPGQVRVNGRNVYYGGTLVGVLNLHGGVGQTPLTVSFNQQSTPEAAQAILRAVQFKTTGSNSAGSRLLQAIVIDNTHLPSTPALEQLNVSLPVTLTLGSSSMTYQRGSGTVFIDTAATLTDVHATTFARGSLTFQVQGGTKNHIALGTTADIAVTNGKVRFDGVVIGTVNGGTVHLNANANTAAVQALIRAVIFSTNGNAASRTATFQFNDGHGGTAHASKTIVVS